METANTKRKIQGEILGLNRTMQYGNKKPCEIVFVWGSV